MALSPSGLESATPPGRERRDPTLTCFAHRAPPCTWFRNASGGFCGPGVVRDSSLTNARAWVVCRVLCVCVCVGGKVRVSEGARALCAPGEGRFLLEMKKVSHTHTQKVESQSLRRQQFTRRTGTPRIHTFSRTTFQSHGEIHSVKQSPSRCPQPLLIPLLKWT